MIYSTTPSNSFIPVKTGGLGPLGKVIAKQMEKKGDAPGIDDEAHRRMEGELEQMQGLSDHQTELSNARRLLRQAGWATGFFVITADILGPFNAPFAISTIGLAPGICLYTLFGLAAGFTGFMIWKIFCQLDSVRFPVKSTPCAIVILGNGGGLSQIVQGKLCFTITVLIWAVVGAAISMVRELHMFSVFADFSMWLNVLIMILSMAFVAHSPPNIAGAIAAYGDSIGTGPVAIKAIVGGSLFNQNNGAFNMVFLWR
ncbi:hypothetical protein MVLG_03862 [Microbotryum lychnidis-dioicae p1A1 Lamole]|uniref:Amino acid transporter transmembrane domain-containing protein n=1 Tax=Microbotryum lychnidis-dioicae (strain p1A1 Lamole / MvSl-1064) TaxID=683840 RepID=U5H9H1_USTV1|nr:hypothetical protein MVLG_03862 [Microbotryum lychnidis-dioicae p1A1 Lamole]|eukprot:KDE05771.1 hypothetical protein MVLG_03862 [Microbotryum lychnidis-dioicae p1A1 Lamole]